MAGVGKSSLDICQDPTLNQSTAFTEAEKEALGLVGLVPGRHRIPGAETGSQTSPHPWLPLPEISCR